MFVCEYACMSEVARASVHMFVGGSRYDQHPINKLFSCVSYKHVYLKPSDYTFVNTPIGKTSITCNDKTQGRKWTTLLRGRHRLEGASIAIV